MGWNKYSDVSSTAKGRLNRPWAEEALISYSGDDFQTYYSFYKPIIHRYTSILGARFVHTVSPTLYYKVDLNHFLVQWGLTRADSARAEDGRYFYGRLYYDPQSGYIPKDKGVDDMASGYRMYGPDYDRVLEYESDRKVYEAYLSGDYPDCSELHR